jgi:hypothetical protein
MFRLPASVGELIRNLGVAAFQVLPLGSRSCRGKRGVMVEKGLGPYVPEPIRETSVMLGNVIGDLCHVTYS